MSPSLPSEVENHEELQGLDKEEYLELLLDGTDDIELGTRGDQLRAGFEFEEVVDIIPVAVVRCKWGGKSRLRFVDPYALVELREIRVHKYLLAIGGFIGDRWCATKEGVQRARPFVKKLGEMLFKLLTLKLSKL